MQARPHFSRVRFPWLLHRELVMSAPLHGRPDLGADGNDRRAWRHGDQLQCVYRTAAVADAAVFARWMLTNTVSTWVIRRISMQYKNFSPAELRAAPVGTACLFPFSSVAACIGSASRTPAVSGSHPGGRLGTFPAWVFFSAPIEKIRPQIGPKQNRSWKLRYGIFAACCWHR